MQNQKRTPMLTKAECIKQAFGNGSLLPSTVIFLLPP